MSLISIAKAVAVEVSISPPVSVVNSSSIDAQRMLQFTQATGEELARRVDWTELRKTTTVTGTGSNADFDLPDDFLRLIPGNSVTIAGAPVRIGLSADEWNSLTPSAGTPRYARLIGKKISFYPYPSNGVVVSIAYQSDEWCSAGSAWAADTDTALIPEVLVTRGSVWRWRRQIGQDYQDMMSEYEAMLGQYEGFDSGMRQP
jgi:hypothetical protein